MNRKQLTWTWRLCSLVLGAATAVLTALPGKAAERVYFNYGPLEFSVSVDALAAFAQEGRIEPELTPYLNRLNPQQQAQLRGFLQSRYSLNPIVTSQITYTTTGERLLRRFGQLIQTQSGQNGFLGIRASVLQSLNDPEGLTAISFLRRFPTNVRLNTDQLIDLAGYTSALLEETDAFVARLEQATSDMASTEPPTDFSKLPDLRQPGELSVTQQTLNLYDTSRDRSVTTDVYLPQESQAKIPVIVISGGLGANRDRFKLLAQHLASHGFAIVVPDHVGSNDQRQKAFFAGLYNENFDSAEFINRPRDVTYVLNQLEQLNQSKFNGQLDLTDVGLFGYSFGGNTALALAGAEIDFDRLEGDCGPQVNVIDISILYQCRALELPRQPVSLKDDRIKAAFLFVPFGNSLYKQDSMNRISIPIMWQAADEDIVTPLLLEQIPFFSQLTTPNRYLVVSKGLPHTRITVQLMDRIMGTNRAASLEQLNNVTQTYLNALTLAFFEIYIDKDEVYRPYLSASYVQALSESPYSLSLVQSLPALAP